MIIFVVLFFIFVVIWIGMMVRADIQGRAKGDIGCAEPDPMWNRGDDDDR